MAKNRRPLNKLHPNRLQEILRHHNRREVDLENAAKALNLTINQPTIHKIRHQELNPTVTTAQQLLQALRFLLGTPTTFEDVWPV